MRKISYLLVLSLLSLSAFCKDTVFYHHTVREVAINNGEETTLSFPFPPIAMNCQPVDIVELYPVQNPNELGSLTIPQGVQVMESLEEANSQNDKDEVLAKLLRLVPNKKAGSSNCAIKLANQDNVHVRFALRKDTSRPLIEFKSVFDRQKFKANEIPSTQKAALSLVKEMATGGKLTFLADITPSKFAPRTYKKKRGFYRFKYIGTDAKNFKAWIVEFQSRYKGRVRHLLKDVQVNEVYSSLWLYPNALKTPYRVKPKEKLRLILVSRNDLEIKDILGKLP